MPFTLGLWYIFGEKKDNTIRFFVDLGALNPVTIFDAFPLPRRDETLDRSANTHYFHCLDLASGYWH